MYKAFIKQTFELLRLTDEISVFGSRSCQTGSRSGVKSDVASIYM
jgi:hypothetical protein